MPEPAKGVSGYDGLYTKGEKREGSKQLPLFAFVLLKKCDGVMGLCRLVANDG
jgi:hypothetical protein